MSRNRASPMLSGPPVPELIARAHLFGIIILAMLGLSSRSEPQRSLAVNRSCAANLARLAPILRRATGESDRYPASLSDVGLPSDELKRLTCPATKTLPGSPKFADEWTDYIY